MRAFSDWCIQKMNAEIGFNGGIAVVQPIENGLLHLLENQDGLYHHMIRGLNNGVKYDEIELIDCIQNTINPFEQPDNYFQQAKNPELSIVISNTTEAGIQYLADDIPGSGQLAKTFPGKLTQLLKMRFEHFKGSHDSGLVFIPCELIENNGYELKECILKYAALWNLGTGFESWIEQSNYFANTLVDRIVPGFPKDEIEAIQERIGFEDQLVVSSEVFHLWVIQGPKEVKERFPADKAGLNVKFVDDIAPYRTRKVRILNGAHTCMVPIGLLDGIETVRENVEHEVIGAFIQQAIDEEIASTIDLPEEELKAFSDEVIERFKNPFIRHELKSIALNSISKFRVRVLPTIKDYLADRTELPTKLLFSLACLIRLYHDSNFKITDDQIVIDYFHKIQNTKLDEQLVGELLAREAFWGEDLTLIKGLKELISKYLGLLETHSATEVVKEVF